MSPLPSRRRRRRRAHRLGLALALAGTTVTALAPAAGAATRTASGSRLGVFAISPARSELITRAPVSLAPTEVSNSTGHRLQVTVSPVILRQTRSGAFTWTRSPAALRAARRRLAASVSGFALRGHDSHTVLTRWTGVGAGRPGYLGVLYRGVPQRTGGQLRVVTQLLAVDLRGVPGARPATGRVTGLAVSEPVRHRLRFVVSVRNTGRTYGTPRSVSLRILDARGRQVMRLAPTTGVILPGVTRDFTVQLPRALAGGRYRAVANARFPAGAPSTRSLSFRLDAGGDLPSPSLVPGALVASGDAGHAATVSVPVSNAGSAPGAPRGTVSLYRMQAGVPAASPAATAALGGRSLRPGGRGTAGAHLGHLRTGEYQVIVHYASPVNDTQPAVVDFRAGAAGSLLGRIAAWLSSHALVLALGTAFAATAGLLARSRLIARRPAPIRLHRI